MTRSIQLIVISVIGIGLLVGCASGPSTKPRGASTAVVDVPQVPADRDVMAMILSAQFALQRDDLAAGAKGFAAASAVSTDPAVAEEATRLALAVKDWPLAGTSLARWRQLAAESPTQLQAGAWLALGEGNENGAFTGLARVVTAFPEDGWRLAAQALLVAPDKPAAARILDRLATPGRLGTKETTWVAASQLAFKLDDKSLAQRLARQAVDRFHGVTAYAWGAHLALERKDTAAARALYAEALARFPADPKLLAGHAAMLADGGDYAGAAKALAVGPQSDQTYAARAAYAVRTDDKVVLAALYGEMVADKSPRGGRRLYLLGQLAELLDRYDAALGWYRAIGDDDDRWFDAQTRIAVVLDRKGDTGPAMTFLRNLESGLAADPDRLSGVVELEAELLRHHDQTADAVTAYSRGLELLPGNAGLLYGRAMIEIDTGDLAAGERDLRAIIDRHPDNAEALNALGYTLADRTDRKAEALELIQRALKLKPDEPAIIDSMGWIRYRMGELDVALTYLRRAFAKQPDPEIAAHLGEVLWVSGDHAAARKVWEEGRKKDGHNKVLLDTIKRLST